MLTIAGRSLIKKTKASRSHYQNCCQEKLHYVVIIIQINSAFVYFPQLEVSQQCCVHRQQAEIVLTKPKIGVLSNLKRSYMLHYPDLKQENLDIDFLTQNLKRNKWFNEKNVIVSRVQNGATSSLPICKGAPDPTILCWQVYLHHWRYGFYGKGNPYWSIPKQISFHLLWFCQNSAAIKIVE